MNLESVCASPRNGYCASALCVSPPPQGFSHASFSSKSRTFFPLAASNSAASAPAGPPPTMAIGKWIIPIGRAKGRLAKTANCSTELSQRRPDGYFVTSTGFLLRGRSHHQALVDEQSSNDQNHHSGERAQNFQNGSDLIYLGEDFDLVFFHLRFGLVQENGIVLVHGESAFVNQKDNEDRRQNTPRDQQPDHWSHTPPR